eukprot:4328162-Prymnesium_polylepis.1
MGAGRIVPHVAIPTTAVTAAREARRLPCWRSAVVHRAGRGELRNLGTQLGAQHLAPLLMELGCRLLCCTLAGGRLLCCTLA